HSGPIGDLRDRGTLVAVLGEHQLSGLENPALGLLAAGRARLGRHGRSILATTEATSSRRSGFSAAERGMRPTKTTSRGTLKAANSRAAWSMTSWAVSRAPFRATTHATARSPHVSSGTPATATSA